MNIYRNDKEIQLTPEELIEAYNEQKEFFLMQDIKRVLAYMYLDGDDSSFVDAWIEENKSENVSDKTKSLNMYFIERFKIKDFPTFINKFNDILCDVFNSISDFDANLSENQQIENAINETIETYVINESLK